MRLTYDFGSDFFILKADCFDCFFQGFPLLFLPTVAAPFSLPPRCTVARSPYDEFVCPFVLVRIPPDTLTMIVYNFKTKINFYCTNAGAFRET